MYQVSRFIQRYQLVLHVHRIDKRPDDLGRWAKDNRHWRFTISCSRVGYRPLSGYYSQGSALTHTPTLADVLQSLTSDARCYEDAYDVLDFATELGYDLDTQEDLKRVRQAYEGCREAYEGLAALVGEEGREELLHLDFDDCGCCYGSPHQGACCPGWFENQETGEIERCDECSLYPDDETAAEAARRAQKE